MSDEFPLTKKMILPIRSTYLELRSYVTLFPVPYLNIVRALPSRRYKVVDKDTELVIEGFPRSGNTFAFVAFSLAQNREPKLAHHLHAPAQVLWAVKNRIPALVLIRDPEDAIISYVIHTPEMSLRQALRNYIRFYSRLAPYRNYFVIARFEEVIRDFGRVIQNVNTKFGTSFLTFEHTDENLKDCFEIIELQNTSDRGDRNFSERTVARPSLAREKNKKAIRELIGNSSFKHLVADARDIYKELTAKSLYRP